MCVGFDYYMVSHYSIRVNSINKRVNISKTAKRICTGSYNSYYTSNNRTFN